MLNDVKPFVQEVTKELPLAVTEQLLVNSTGGGKKWHPNDGQI